MTREMSEEKKKTVMKPAEGGMEPNLWRDKETASQADD